jgi:enoyl-CoA hydratase/carnithine racemase
MAREIFMTAEPYGADHALRVGFVNRVFECDRFWGAVVALAESIAARRQEALKHAKRCHGGVRLRRPVSVAPDINRYCR